MGMIRNHNLHSLSVLSTGFLAENNFRAEENVPYAPGWNCAQLDGDA